MKQKCIDGQEHNFVSFHQGRIRIAAGTIHDNEEEVVVCRRCGLLFEDCQEPEPAPAPIEEIPF